MIAAALLLAAGFDGDAALRHASALSALGPRPWGSPRTAAAAAYIASQLRTAGADGPPRSPSRATGSAAPT